MIALHKLNVINELFIIPCLNGFLVVVLDKPVGSIVGFIVHASPVGLKVGLIVVLLYESVVLSTKTLPLTTVVLYLSELVEDLVVEVGNHENCETVVCTSGLYEVKNGIIVTLKSLMELALKCGGSTVVVTVGLLLEIISAVVLFKLISVTLR